MEVNLKLFDQIWLNYFYKLPVNEYEYEKYINIIHKIRKNQTDFSEEKTVFIDLIETISLTIYKRKYKNITHKDYDENNNYENDKELNCCYKIKSYLKSVF
jgi:hypothetical protein